MKKAIVLISLAAALSAPSAIAQDNDFAKGPIKHVLLISIDGMHAVDLLNCANGVSTVNSGDPYCPAFAALHKTGVNYVAASTSKPSDSFPGLISIVTGGSPALTGIYYDVAYARNLDAPDKPPVTASRPAPARPARLPPEPPASMKKASTSTRRR